VRPPDIASPTRALAPESGSGIETFTRDTSLPARGEHRDARGPAGAGRDGTALVALDRDDVSQNARHITRWWLAVSLAPMCRSGTLAIVSTPV
jgi:hypothetical protein